ncbi:hypothetical protein MSP8886_00506 [Marinomonas spartinae]|uniref:Uncharacterized protein n=1 Tax=Marinomonas spartinae TaxID=1792290 RepID=A0A1A8T4P1_9GAMM|nr:hypothetical protein [Marinomonas spartinae]SBS26127.1 hypothetical protein MSP8886_00506 [Marinomonas spartinae]
MSSINLPVEWNEGDELPNEGLYFVAIRYPSGFGCYDFVVWNGEEWELGYTAEVVGWVAIDNVLSLIKAGWPQGDNAVSEAFERRYIERKTQRKNEDDEDDFVEVT